MSAKPEPGSNEKDAGALPVGDSSDDTPVDSSATAGEGPAAAKAPIPGGPLTAQQIEELKAKAAKADEHWDRLLRTAAEMENLRKRAARDRQEAVKYANESLLARLIPALDNFDMALAAANHIEGASLESLKTGIAMIHQQFKSALVEAGLEEIDATDQPFNPNFHEAVSQRETTEAPEGQVVQQLRKGYKLRDRLLRPATVIVARKPSA
jgi:molecular chaperone GrpE